MDKQDKAELLKKQFPGVFTNEDKTNIPKLEGDLTSNISHLKSKSEYADSRLNPRRRRFYNPTTNVFIF